MQISWKIIIFVITARLIFCENFLNSTENQDLIMISKVLHDITDEFLLSRNMQFDIFIFKSKT